MNKRGQVTLFIIIAIAVIVIVALFLTLNFQTDLFKQKSVPSELIPTKILVDTCLEEKAYESVYLLGLGGGYIYPEEYFEPEFLGRISYWYKPEKDLRPSTQKISGEMEKYVNLNLPLCIIRGDKNNKINWDEPTTQITILEDYVVFNVQMDVSLKGFNSKYLLREFETRIPLRLQKVYEIAYELSSEDMNSRRGYLITDYNVDDLKLTLLTYSNNTIIYFLEDNKSLIYNGSYMFRFGGKYV